MNERRTEPVILLTSAVFCIASFYFFDRAVALFFQQFNDILWTGAWKAITKAGESQWYLVGGIAIYAWFRKKNHRKAQSGLFLLSTVAVSGLAADLLKFIFGRARPKLLLEQGIYGFGFFHIDHAWISFPSGHSATALSAALTLSLLMPRFKSAFIAGGIIIAASRVVLDQHYLSDIVAGSTLGIVTVTMLYQRYFKTALDETRILQAEP
ncbi:MAG: phosphatase PAP2 family protein [Chlorobiaceae bacterium]|nr:phosphatase PAP2 family protein [Chlorobiaceae bacterium]